MSDASARARPRGSGGGGDDDRQPDLLATTQLSAPLTPPGNLSHPPSPSTIHPEYITDAHHFGSPLALKAGDAKVVPVVQGAVAVDVDGRGVAPAADG